MTIDKRHSVDPLISLKVSRDEKSSSSLGGSTSSNVTSLCFLPSRPKHSNGALIDESSDEEELTLRCSTLLRSEKKSDADITAQARETAASMSLQSRYLATCHLDGKSFLWDLGNRRIHQESPFESRGPGLLLRRIFGDEKVMYQTRDPEGTVSLHSVEQSLISIHRYPTQSVSFCTAAPCYNDENLVVLPMEDSSFFQVRDWRVPGDAASVYVSHGAGHEQSRKHGMLTSLALCNTNSALVSLCGMEDGSVYLHDVRKKSEPLAVKLSRDPILSLDVSPSNPKSPTDSTSMLFVAGMAGDAADMADIPITEQGTVALVKATLSETATHARVRTRLNTCQKGTRIGVNLCQFRNDGRLFAVGGWDHRLRIFDRSNGALVAILRGHSRSIAAFDWSPDAASSGLLATAAADGLVHVWRCFPR